MQNFMIDFEEINAAFDAVTTRRELYALVKELVESRRFTDPFSLAYIDGEVDSVRLRLGPPAKDGSDEIIEWIGPGKENSR